MSTLVQCENEACGKTAETGESLLIDWIVLKWRDGANEWDACSHECAIKIIESGVFKV